MDVQKRLTLSVETMEVLKGLFPMIVVLREKRMLLLLKAKPSRKYIMAHVQVRMTISLHLFNFYFGLFILYQHYQVNHINKKWVRCCLYFSSFVLGSCFSLKSWKSPLDNWLFFLFGSMWDQIWPHLVKSS